MSYVMQISYFFPMGFFGVPVDGIYDIRRLRGYFTKNEIRLKGIMTFVIWIASDNPRNDLNRLDANTGIELLE